MGNQRAVELIDAGVQNAAAPGELFEDGVDALVIDVAVVVHQRCQAGGHLFGQRLRQFFHLFGSRQLVTQAKIGSALHQQHQQSQANQDNSGAVQAEFQFSAGHAGSLGILDTLCCQKQWR
ncbi:hypothetical protein D3C71_1462450 [compost metagenome]